MAAFVLLGLALPPKALASPVALQEYLFNLNGSPYYNTTVVPGLNSVGFDTGTGLGTLVLTFDPGVVGAYFFDAYFDHELHVPFYNERGAVSGAPGAGVSWQIDEPGFGDGNRLGTIYDNASNNALDNTNYVQGGMSNFFFDCGANGGGAPDPACNNDVSLALGFNFVLAANEQAVITLNASQARPSGGFFLQQFSPAEADQPADQLFLTGAIAINPINSVPEPSSVLLMSTGLIGIGLIGVARRAVRRKVPPLRTALCK